MKVILKIVIVLIFSNNSINCQNTKVDINELEKAINLAIKDDGIQDEELQPQIIINIEDSLLIYKRAVPTLSGERSKERIQYNIAPFRNIHPEGIFTESHHSGILIKFFSRRNDDGFQSFVRSDNKIRLISDLSKPNSNYFSIVLNKNIDKQKEDYIYKTLKLFFEEISNEQIKNELPPENNTLIISKSRIRGATFKMKSVLEKRKLVLPIHTVHTKPKLSKKESFKVSLDSFEREIIGILKQKNIKIDKHIKGAIYIDVDGLIIDVVLENSKYCESNELARKIILNYNKWRPAIHNKKKVVCKVIFFIDKTLI